MVTAVPVENSQIEQTVVRAVGVGHVAFEVRG
jgi:hypothetical protein